MKNNAIKSTNEAKVALIRPETSKIIQRHVKLINHQAYQHQLIKFQNSEQVLPKDLQECKISNFKRSPSEQFQESLIIFEEVIVGP